MDTDVSRLVQVILAPVGHRIVDLSNEHDVVAAANAHRLAGVLAEAAVAERVVVSQEDHVQLAMRSLGILNLNNQALAALRLAAKRLDDAGLSVAVMKGIAISLQTYKRLDVRPASDVDLFMRPGTALLDVVDALGVVLSADERDGIEGLVESRTVFRVLV
ncbi:MAG: nucleotidyltransferase family protein [Acidimicrobiales bacterium]